MVKNEGVHTIIMLCKFKDDLQVQSSEYFPNAKGKTLREYEGVKIRARSHNPTMNLTERRFLLDLDDGKTREIAHFQWEGWPDQGVPSRRQYETLLYLIRKIIHRRKYGPQPVIVHCSAGIGRSGTLVAIHNLIQIIQLYHSQKEEIVDEEKWRLSVFSVVRRLREQRFGSVQTNEQYEFIYELVKEILTNKTLIS